jgi:hypothetical protein
MSAAKQSVWGWSLARLAHGMGTIRIAIPVWTPSRPKPVVVKAAPRVSQEELLNLFQSELRPAKDFARGPVTNKNIVQNMQRRCNTGMLNANRAA